MPNARRAPHPSIPSLLQRPWPALLLALAAALPLPARAQAIGPAPSAARVAAQERLEAAYARAVVPGEAAERQAALLARVLDRIERSAMAPPDLGRFADAAVAALDRLPPGAGEPAETFARAVDAGVATFDARARYVPPAPPAGEAGALPEGAFVGVGLQLEPADGALRVVEPMPATPAARAGLRPGDLIVGIDGMPAQGLPDLARLRGAAGTPVALTVRRAGLEAPWTVALTREAIVRPVLRWRLEGEVLVLTLSTFNGPVTAQLEKAVAEASAQVQPRGVVLDLRGNGGGLLREGVRTADAFLGGGEVASMRARPGQPERRWQADEAQLLAGVPMVVLVNRGSASASELVAAALQAHGRAAVLGQRSLGKGSVQTTYPLGDRQGGLRLTTAHYYAPGDIAVDGFGVQPDLLLADGEAATATATAPNVLPAALCTSLAPGVADKALACALAWLRAGGPEPLRAAVLDAR